MKQVFFLAVIATLISCSNSDKKKTGSKTVASNDSTLSSKDTSSNNANIAGTSIQWLDSTFLDLGKQKEGKEIEITFRFKNTGNANLIIQNVSAQCGCTIPEKPEQPFAPGEEGTIKAKYNGSGHGEVRKEIYVTTNTDPSAQTLTFRAELSK